MNDLIAEALEIRASIEADQHLPTDDDAFIFYRTSARLSNFSTGVHCCTLQPRKLLKNDGTIDASQIIRTVRVSDPGVPEDDASFGGTEFLDPHLFLERERDSEHAFSG